MVYHYKSLDTWLDGICKSHCPDHAWSSSAVMWAPGKKSIFNIDKDYDEADMNAPEFEDDDVGEDGEKGSVKKKGSALTKTCFVGQGNNDKLVKSTLVDNLGFKLMARGMMFSNDYRLKWTQTSMEINFMHFKEGKHICNHIANSTKILTSKIATIETLENLKLSMEGGSIKSALFGSLQDFVPETYRLDVVADLY